MRNRLLGAALTGLAAIGSWISAGAADPAFDCARATHEIELLVCKDDGLAAKDRRLADVYAAALKVLEGVADRTEATAALKAYQRGWVGGRNECWKAADKRQCASDNYDRRIAELQARYFLVQAGEPVFYMCDDNSEIVATFVPTDPPAVRLERGDSMQVGLLEPAGSGSKYEAEFGVTFWTKGEEAQVDWPQGAEFSCKVRK